MLIPLLLFIAVLSTSLATIAQATFSTSSSSKIALQALQYADAKSEILRATKYDELTAHERTVINNSIYQDEVIIGPETSYPGNEEIKQKVCTVNVYRLDEEYPRYSLNVIRTSVSLDNSVPVGSILPYNGDLDDIPENWALCDGKNGTPDLRDRFITGAGNSYDIGDFGGENEVKLEAEQNVSHYHYFGYNANYNNGQWPCLRDSAIIPKYPTVNGVVPSASKWNGSGGGNWWGWDKGNSSYLLSNLVTSVSYGLDSSKPHENRPPYYALYYIMKIK